MKKIKKLIPFLILALLVLSLSGCNNSPTYYSSSGSTTNNDGGSGTGDDTTDENTTTSGGSATITTETRGDFGEVTNIVLSTTETSSVNIAANSIKNYDCVWNITPNDGEYWTYGGNTYDDEQEVQSAMGIDDTGIYIAHDIRYVPNTLDFSGQVPKATDDNEKCYVAYYSESFSGGSNYILAAIPTSSSTDDMTHSASDAYNNPVLHITKAGTYALSGTWNGQIWVDIPDGEEDSTAKVVLILDGLTVNCGVAPAIVFKEVYEYAGNYNGNTYDTAAGVKAASMDVGPAIADTNNGEVVAGATVILGSGTTNTLTGTNVARMNKLTINTSDGYSESDVGSYVKAQKKLYKLDAALHSRMSIVIDNEDSSTDGSLVINAEYEGLGSEKHVYMADGNITITAADDGINVDEDNISVFHMNGGTLNVTSTGGDGIDSNGYLIFTGADSLVVAAAGVTSKPSYENLNSQAEGLLDANCGIYMSSAVYDNFSVGENSGSTGGGNGGTPPDNGNGGSEGPGGTPPDMQSGEFSDGEEPPTPPDQQE